MQNRKRYQASPLLSQEEMDLMTRSGVESPSSQWRGVEKAGIST